MKITFQLGKQEGCALPRIAKVGCLVLMLFMTLAFASANTNSIAEQAQHQPVRLTQLQFQLTDAAITVDDLVSDPALFHNFKPLAPKQSTIRTSEQQAVWLMVKIANPFPDTWQAVLSYHFLPADRVSFYKLATDLPTAVTLGETGSELPFVERALPLLNFSQPIKLEKGEQGTFLLRLQDAALLGTELTLATLPTLLIASQQQLLFDSIINGALILLITLALCRGVQQQQAALYALAGFYLTFLLILGSLNSLAFSLLWPLNPELNPVILYISVGLALLCLTLFNRFSLPHPIGRYAISLNNLCLLLALLLLFSPLYASGKLKLTLLFICVTLVLAVTVLQALFTSLTSSVRYSSRFSLLAAAATLNLLLVQTRYLSNFAHWLDAGVLMLLTASAVLLLAIPKRQPMPI